MNALITGISSGIGLATARFLAGRGVRVFGTMRSLDKSRGLIRELQADYGERMEIIPMDITSDDSVRNGVNAVLNRVNHIDSLVCNAGISVQGSIEEVPVEVVKQLYDVNVFGTLRTIKAVLPQMRERRSGRIVLVSSLAAIAVVPFEVDYCATKYATDAITEGLRQETKPFGIKVSAVRPGDICTSIRENTIRVIPDDSPYRPWSQGACRVIDDTVTNGPSPDLVARKIYQVLNTANPKTYYTVAAGMQTFVPFLLRLANYYLKEMVIRIIFHVDKKTVE
jgi:short-subunit dehydrogenase